MQTCSALCCIQAFVTCRCIGILSHALEADLLVDTQCSHPASLGDRLIDLCKRLAEQYTQRVSECKIQADDAEAPLDDTRLVVCPVHTHHDSRTCLATHDSCHTLQESQRLVMSSLTVRMQEALKHLAIAQQENCRLRERLRVLRISIGDDDPADSENSPLALDVAISGALPTEV